jgi:transposase
MYVERVPNRNSPPAVLLREGWREGKRVRKRTIANLSQWPEEKVEALRRLLRDERLFPADSLFTVEHSLPHGHVEAVLGTIRAIGLDSLLAPHPGRQASLVLAMIAEQIIHPTSKLGMTRLWHTTTLAEELGVGDADEDELYEAMDWLLERQERVERKLAARHLADGEQVFYDVSSSYYEGRSCPLATFGYNRDGKRGKTIVVYGLMTDRDGCPVSVQVYSGRTADPRTVPDQVDKLHERFGLERVVLVGDRGMLTQARIESLREFPGLGWISALRFPAIRELANEGEVCASLFDQRNLAEISSPHFPGERLIACFNPLLAEERRRKREALLEATERLLDGVALKAARRTKRRMRDEEIALAVGRVINRYKVAKHFQIDIANGALRYQRKARSIEREQELDGLYVIRTSEPRRRLSAADTVRAYKRLGNVEQAFRTIKGLDRIVRPIRHRDENRVRAHVFLAMLAYYVSWHMRRALAPMLYVDDQLESHRRRRDPVARATPSPSSQRKKRTGISEEGHPVHSFDTLIASLATRCRNTCRVSSDEQGPTFSRLTELTLLQAQAFHLLGLL